MPSGIADCNQVTFSEIARAEYFGYRIANREDICDLEAARLERFSQSGHFRCAKTLIHQRLRKAAAGARKVEGAWIKLRNGI